MPLVLVTVNSTSTGSSPNTVNRLGWRDPFSLSSLCSSFIAFCALPNAQKVLSTYLRPGSLFRTRREKLMRVHHRRGRRCALLLIPAATQPTDAPTGFDNKSNGHGGRCNAIKADQVKFDETEDSRRRPRPVIQRPSPCRECHQNPISGGASQVSELRVGHNGPDGRFPYARHPHRSRRLKPSPAARLVNDRAICPQRGLPRQGNPRERVPNTETIRAFSPLS